MPGGVQPPVGGDRDKGRCSHAKHGAAARDAAAPDRCPGQAPQRRRRAKRAGGTSVAQSAREDGGAAATAWAGNETGRAAAGATMRPAMCCGQGTAAEHGDAELPRLVDEVLGDAGAGEGDDALRQEVGQFVVAAKRGGASVAVPVWLADDLVDAVRLGPARRDLLDTGAAAVDEHDVGVLAAGLVEALDHRRPVGDVPAAGDGDEGALRQVRGGAMVRAQGLSGAWRGTSPGVALARATVAPALRLAEPPRAEAQRRTPKRLAEGAHVAQ